MLLILRFNHPYSIELFSDIESALHIAKNPVFSWTHKTYWNWLSLCSWCHNWRFDYSGSCFYFFTVSRYFHKGSWQDTVWCFTLQVGHSWSPCSNLRGGYCGNYGKYYGNICKSLLVSLGDLIRIFSTHQYLVFWVD